MLNINKNEYKYNLPYNRRTITFSTEESSGYYDNLHTSTSTVDCNSRNTLRAFVTVWMVDIQIQWSISHHSGKLVLQ